MAAPTVAAHQEASANTTTALTLSGVSAGDLIIVAGFFQLADPGVSLALTDGASAQVGTTGEQGLAANADATSYAITNRFVFIYSILVTTAPASGTVTCTWTNWPSTGTSRRWGCMAVTPPAGRAWGSNRKARLLDHSTAALVDSNTHTSINFTTLATGKQEDNPCIVIDGAFGMTTSSFSADWSLDGTANTSPDPTAEWVLAGSNPHGSFAYSLYDANQFMGQSGKSSSSEPTIIKYLVTTQAGYLNGVGFLYAVEGGTTKKDGRGRAAAKAGGVGHPYKLTQVRGRAAAKSMGKPFSSAGTTNLASGRGRAASAGLGAGHLFTTHKSGRGFTAAKATGKAVHNLRDSGRGFATSGASAIFYYKPQVYPGAAKNASKANATISNLSSRASGRARMANYARAGSSSVVPNRGNGRGRAACKAGGKPLHVIKAQGRGVTVTKSVGYTHGQTKSNGRGRVVAKASGSPLLHRTLRGSGRGRGAAKASSRFHKIGFVPPPPARTGKLSALKYFGSLR